MKRIYSIATFVLVACSTAVTFGAGRDVNTCTNICAGQNVACKGQESACGGGSGSGLSGGLNALGDRVNWGATTTIMVDNVGSISSTKKYRLSLPGVNEKKIIRLTPTRGNLANQQIDVMLVSFDVQSSLPKNLPSIVVRDLKEAAKSSFKYVTKIYRRTGNEKLWVEISKNPILLNTAPTAAGVYLDLTFSNDGLVTVPSSMVTDQYGNKSMMEGMSIDLAAFL